MNIPDGNKIVDLLMAILKQKIDWWTEAVIAIIAASVMMLAYCDIVWFRDIPSLYLVGTFIVFMFFTLHKPVGAPLKSYLKSRKERIQCKHKFDKLSEAQKDLLTRIFRNGNRKFRFETEKDHIDYIIKNAPRFPRYILNAPVEISLIPPGLIDPRELEELINYNYIEVDGKFKLSASFSVTENGWHELKKNITLESN